MPEYLLTTVESVFSTLTVEAESEDDAKRMIDTRVDEFESQYYDFEWSEVNEVLDDGEHGPTRYVEGDPQRVDERVRTQLLVLRSLCGNSKHEPNRLLGDILWLVYCGEKNCKLGEIRAAIEGGVDTHE